MQQFKATTLCFSCTCSDVKPLRALASCRLILGEHRSKNHRVISFDPDECQVLFSLMQNYIRYILQHLFVELDMKPFLFGSVRSFWLLVCFFVLCLTVKNRNVTTSPGALSHRRSKGRVWLSSNLVFSFEAPTRPEVGYKYGKSL